MMMMMRKPVEINYCRNDLAYTTKMEDGKSDSAL